MKQLHYIGLDVATMAGIAKWIPEINVAVVDEMKGTPNHQLQYIINSVLPPKEMAVETIFVLEKPFHFQNANTTRSLLERYGFIKYSLLGFGYQVREPNLNSARAWLGVRDKQGVFDHYVPHLNSGRMLTSNHTDALLVAMYEAQQDGFTVEWSSLQIMQGVFA